MLLFEIKQSLPRDQDTLMNRGEVLLAAILHQMQLEKCKALIFLIFIF